MELEEKLRIRIRKIRLFQRTFFEAFVWLALGVLIFLWQELMWKAPPKIKWSFLAYAWSSIIILFLIKNYWFWYKETKYPTE